MHVKLVPYYKVLLRCLWRKLHLSHVFLFLCLLLVSFVHHSYVVGMIPSMIIYEDAPCTEYSRCRVWSRVCTASPPVLCCVLYILLRARCSRRACLMFFLLISAI